MDHYFKLKYLDQFELHYRVNIIDTHEDYCVIVTYLEICHMFHWMRYSTFSNITTEAVLFWLIEGIYLLIFTISVHTWEVIYWK